MDLESIARLAVGAACAIFDGDGRVLLVRHTYGRLNWELPGGLGERGESPSEAAARELFEETGIRAEIDRLTGVYHDPYHDFGPMLHFVFRCAWRPEFEPTPSSPEIGETGYWPLDALPRPMSDFTERRIRDALQDGPVAVERIGRREWRE